MGYDDNKKTHKKRLFRIACNNYDFILIFYYVLNSKLNMKKEKVKILIDIN